MHTLAFAVVAAGILAFGLVSARVRDTVVTPPMVFVVFGVLVGPEILGLVDLELGHGFIRTLAEITLVLLLFTDAARIDLALLRREHDLPVRLLSLALPLSVVLGTVAATLLFDGLRLWHAAIVAVLLAPTDAALGQAVVASRAVPVRIRQTLNVESGLNDGIVLPVFLVVLSLADAQAPDATALSWVRFAAFQLVLGPVVGVAVGSIGGRLVERATTSGWMNRAFQELSALGLALFAFAGAELVGGNGFIAAFTAGLTLGNTARAVCSCLYEFGEAEGQLLTLLIFLVLGAVLAPQVFHDATARDVVYAVLSLAVVRPLAVAAALAGSRLRWETLLFVGWFGPRGVATILFALLMLEEAHVVGGPALMVTAMTAVLMSIFAHGLTAAPAARWYAARLGPTRDDRERPEHMPVGEMPLRMSSGG